MSQKVYDVIFKSILESLDKGVIPWNMPWSSGGAPKRAINAVTGKTYKGSNEGLLFISQLVDGHSSPKYATYKQWTDLGRQVGKGQKSTPIVFWNIKEKSEEKDGYCFARFYSVFNESQLTDYILPANVPKIDFVPIDSAEMIVKNSPMNILSIKHDQQKAFYSPHLDYINMPKRETFKSADLYYSVLFHEMGHATGHEQRLKRDMSGMFGNHAYSREELIAELTSAFLGAESGIHVPIDAHASYCNSWSKKFRDQPKEMLSAFTHAARASNYILNIKEEKTVKNEEMETTV